MYTKKEKCIYIPKDKGSGDNSEEEEGEGEGKGEGDPQCQRGPRGYTGLPGPQGPRGNQGLRGPVGPQGPVGDRGVRGNRGPIGLPGNDGPAGLDGKDGEDGIFISPLRNPGDILTHNGSEHIALPIGPDGSFLRSNDDSLGTELDWVGRVQRNNSSMYLGQNAGQPVSNVINPGFNNLGLGANALGYTNSNIVNTTSIGVNSFANFRSGANSVSIGTNCFENLLDGRDNIGVGTNVAKSVEYILNNTFVGSRVLENATTVGENNTITGSIACNPNIEIGTNNTIIGSDSGSVAGTTYTNFSNNILIGKGAGSSTTTTDINQVNNIIIGTNSGANYNGKSGIIHIGSNNSGLTTAANDTTYIQNIVTSNLGGNPVPVVVSSANQLGIQTSSRRFKENIRPITTETSEKIHSLKPVHFTYIDDESKTEQLGLIAEDVYEILPEVVYKTDSETDGVKESVITGILYEKFIPLLIDQVQQQKLNHDKFLNDMKEQDKKFESMIKEQNDRFFSDLE